MNIEIVRPREEERKHIENLLALVIRDACRREGVTSSSLFDIDNEIHSQHQTLHRDFETGGAEEYFLVAKRARQIVGTIAHGTVNDIIRHHCAIDPSAHEIKSAYVLPDFQGQGIGSLLFETIATRTRVMNIPTVCLDSGYALAQKFWRRRLGEPHVVLEDFWGKGADHNIWMWGSGECVMKK